MPYLLASLVQTPELSQPQFRSERRQNQAFEDSFVKLVRIGSTEGDFRSIDPVLGAKLVLSVSNVLTGPFRVADVDELVNYALLGLLCDGTRPHRV